MCFYLYRDVDFADAVKEITGGEGVNGVYDSIGKDTIRQSMKCLKPRGVLSNNGNASGPIGALDPLDLAEAGTEAAKENILQEFPDIQMQALACPGLPVD